MLLFPLLGKGRTWHRVVDGRRLETEFPFWMYEERLLNWQVTYTLNQNEYTTPLPDQMRQGGESAKPFERLYHLIAENAKNHQYSARLAVTGKVGKLHKAGSHGVKRCDARGDLSCHDELVRVYLENGGQALRGAS